MSTLWIQLEVIPANPANAAEDDPHVTTRMVVVAPSVIAAVEYQPEVANEHRSLVRLVDGMVYRVDGGYIDIVRACGVLSTIAVQTGGAITRPVNDQTPSRAALRTLIATERRE